MNGDRQRGSAVLELVLVTPLLVLMLLFVVFCGRLQGANLDVRSAAGASAWAASLETSRSEAARAARVMAEETLAHRHVTCSSLRVDLFVSSGDGGGAAVGLNNGDEVTVTVTCVVSLRDVTGLGVGSDRTLSASATEVVDELRGL